MPQLRGESSNARTIRLQFSSGVRDAVMQWYKACTGGSDGTAGYVRKGQTPHTSFSVKAMVPQEQEEEREADHKEQKE